jgi:hypothetical protein
MDDIHIKRYTDDPQVKGCIEPESGKWQLLVDHDETPHLLIRCQVEDDDGNVVPGWMAIDDLLPEGLLITDMMKSVFGGQLSEEEQAELEEKFRSRAPCPK